MTSKTFKYVVAATTGVGVCPGCNVHDTCESEIRRNPEFLWSAARSRLYDGHRETTFGMIHPIRPFYSLLIRVNPDNPADPADFKCDLCEGDVPAGENGGTKYTFKIRKGVKFHDGTPLTSADIKATFDKIIFPT